MTADEIAARLVSQPITPSRVQKLVQLCARMRVDLDQVIAKLPEAQQAEVKQAL